MDPFGTVSACETIIQERELQKHPSGRMHSENVVAMRLLSSRDQMSDAYAELYFLFRSNAHLRTFFGTPATLPEDFNLSDATLAAIANSALALEPDDRIRATEVRDFRPDWWSLDSRQFDDTGP